MEHIPHRWPQPAAALALAAASGRGLHELMFRELQPFRHNRGRLDVCATATHSALYLLRRAPSLGALLSLVHRVCVAQLYPYHPAG